MLEISPFSSNTSVALNCPGRLKLSVSQHEALLPLKNLDEKRVLAEAAVTSRWSVEKLESQVRRLHRPHKGGRPVEPGMRVLVRRLDKLLVEALREGLDSGLDDLSPAEARRLLAMVNGSQATLERIEKLLTKRAITQAE